MSFRIKIILLTFCLVSLNGHALSKSESYCDEKKCGRTTPYEILKNDPAYLKALEYHRELKLKDAFKYFKRAAEAGNLLAAYDVGRIVRVAGMNTRKSKGAEYWYQQCSLHISEFMSVQCADGLAITKIDKLMKSYGKRISKGEILKLLIEGNKSFCKFKAKELVEKGKSKMGFYTVLAPNDEGKNMTDEELELVIEFCQYSKSYLKIYSAEHSFILSKLSKALYKKEMPMVEDGVNDLWNKILKFGLELE